MEIAKVKYEFIYNLNLSLSYTGKFTAEACEGQPFWIVQK